MRILWHVTRLPGRSSITAEDLIDIDILWVRSVTHVNATLLAKANRLKYVGTATIGTDHIDTELLAAAATLRLARHRAVTLLL